MLGKLGAVGAQAWPVKFSNPKIFRNVRKLGNYTVREVLMKNCTHEIQVNFICSQFPCNFNIKQIKIHRKFIRETKILL